MKTYVITLSQVFPVAHQRAGEPTEFKDAFWSGQSLERVESFSKYCKIHTIRANYELWKKRFDDIAAGKACLSVRQWTGKPYRSKQVELARLTKEDGIGIQKLNIVKERYHSREMWLGYVDGRQLTFDRLANNDGLSLEDWFEWFKNYDLNKPMAVIHFTKFRYLQFIGSDYGKGRDNSDVQQ